MNTGLVWSIVTTTGRGQLPEPRCGHTLTLTGAGDSSSRHLIVAFGETAKTKERKFFNDVYALSNGREWSMMNITGRVPVLPRSNHSATVFGDDLNSIFFFGGTSLHSFLDDSVVLTGVGTDKPKWVPIYTAHNPNGRRGHSVVAKANSSGEFLLFGGQRGSLVLNDLWTFDITNNIWSEARCAGDVPAPRAFHSAFAVNSNICIFGGMDANGVLRDSDFFTANYDLREGKWTRRVLNDPNIVGDFCAHFIGAPYYKVLLYGSKSTRDTFYLDIDPESGFPRGPAQVFRLQNNNFQPERRNRPASALMFGEPLRLFVFGGWKVDSDPPVASAGLRCFSFRVPVSDIIQDPSKYQMKVTKLVEEDLSSSVIKRIKLSQRPVKSRPAPTSLRANETGHLALLKIRGIAESLQVDSKHDLDSLAFQVIENLWLQPTIRLDPSAEDRSFFFLPPAQLLELINLAHRLLKSEPTVLEIDGPTKIFGDIHGQFEDMCRLFKAFGSPDHHIGDIEECKYIFLGDIVDRGRHSLEVLTLLVALKIQYPTHVYLVRGNHEDSAMNKNYGFGQECMSRFGNEVFGADVWTAYDNMFNVLPLAAVVNKRILCVHGGIGRLETIDQIRNIARPIKVDHDPSRGDQVLMDILWSDPAESDAELGISENKARRVSVVFGADKVTDFCTRNNIDVIVRAHQCVAEGYEFFAKGHLITIFSATNYCGVQRNNGAILHVTDRKDHWLITPKFIECDLTPNTWVNLPNQLPPSPMRVSKRTATEIAPSIVSNASSMMDIQDSTPFLFGDVSQSKITPSYASTYSSSAYQPFVMGGSFASPRGSALTSSVTMHTPPVVRHVSYPKR